MAIRTSTRSGPRGPRAFDPVPIGGADEAAQRRHAGFNGPLGRRPAVEAQMGLLDVEQA